MIEKPRRTIKVIVDELQIALKRETADIIAIGELLLEAQALLEHGLWLPWLKLNFGSSVRTAQNYMSAARFASKYATVAHLKLRPSVLYWLGQNLEAIPLDEIEAIFKVAETKWVDVEHALAIIEAIHEERRSSSEEQSYTPEERAENERLARERERAIAEERARREEEKAEIDDILDSPPELPPPPELTPEAAVHDFTVASFDQAVETLSRLQTKALSSFVATTHPSDDIKKVADFLRAVADAVQKKTEQTAA
jgi:hypothetical protein